MLGRNQRAHLGRLVERVADLETLDLRHERLDKSVVDFPMNVDALHRDADLTRIVHPVGDRRVGRPLEVRARVSAAAALR